MCFLEVLAAQSIFPKYKTWKITLIVGGITTLAACFPALVMKLLEFVALYGLLLMPMGAIIFADFYFYKKLKLILDWASHSGSLFNGAAGWFLFLILVTCLCLRSDMHR